MKFDRFRREMHHAFHSIVRISYKSQFSFHLYVLMLNVMQDKMFLLFIELYKHGMDRMFFVKESE